MFEMKLATCEALMGSYQNQQIVSKRPTYKLSRENTYRLVIVDFEVGEVRYLLKKENRMIRDFKQLVQPKGALLGQ